MSQVYFDNNDGYNEQNQPQARVRGVSLAAKTFLYLALAICLSGIVAISLPYAMIGLGIGEAYYITVTVSAIALIVFCFIINFIILRSKSKIVQTTFFVIYSLLWGVFLSSFVMMFDMASVGYTFLITGGVFLLMGGYGYLTKKNLDGFGSVMAMLLMSALLVSIVNIFFANVWIEWVVSYVMLAAVIGFVAVDFNRLKRMNQTGVTDNGLALLMAINLYSDFIYIFVRLLPLIASASSNN